VLRYVIVQSTEELCSMPRTVTDGIWEGDCLGTGKPSRYNSTFPPSRQPA